MNVTVTLNIGWLIVSLLALFFGCLWVMVGFSVVRERGGRPTGAEYIAFGLGFAVIAVGVMAGIAAL